MPEYLAPAVYVEEVDTGSKPIEGVSTSTAGMIGVTERGPVNVPTLVTSYDEFRRVFGDTLNADTYGAHRFLPHAVQGFFANGGKRVFVTRVLDLHAASLAHTRLFEHQEGIPTGTLLTRAAVGAGSVLFVWPDAAGAIVANDWVRIGGGSDTEYRQAALAPAAATTAVAVATPLQRTRASAVGIVEHYAALPGGPIALTLTGAHRAGATSILAGGAAGVVADRVVRISEPTVGGREELIYAAGVVDLGGNNWRITLETPLQLDHANAEDVEVQAALPAPGAGNVTDLTRSTVGGDTTALVTASGAFAAGEIVRVVNGTRGELRRIGDPARVGFGVPATFDARGGTYVERVTRADDGTITLKTLDEAVGAGSLWFTVDNRTGLLVGQVLRIGVDTDPDVEYAVIRELPDRTGAAPDAGRVVLETPLSRAHGGPTVASRQIVRAQTITLQVEAGSLFHDLVPGATFSILTAPPLGAPPGPNDVLRFLVPGAPAYLRIASSAARAVLELGLVTPLLRPHAAPQPIVERLPLLDVVALDPGAWGNRLRVAARRETTPLVRTTIRTDGTGIQDLTHVRLDSSAGVEVGAVLSLADALGIPTGAPFKVIHIDRQNGYLLTLNTPIPGAAAAGSAIVSIEFALSVYLSRQPDPAQPSRDQQVIDSETFRHLSLDPRHSRYVQRVIGTTWTPPTAVDDDGRPLRRADRRSEGESAYIRIRDLAQALAEPNRTTTLESIRFGPEFLWDVHSDGRRDPARFGLLGGSDQALALGDGDYIGQDDPNPERRTGLQSLRSVEEISIVAAPGQFGALLQGALINHCESLRYRFAVLDGSPPPNDSMNDIQFQRQQFDTKYAALYHPWLVIPHPYPVTATGTVPGYPIPPSGHVLGIYARTDIERGVHKAPANEVVRGIVGLQRVLNKEQQDILNPYPVNINVIRDFRTNNRGIRVYGGRCITSDSDWKYVNVRRLLIFIEASIDRGLQWVVFEPNAEPLWARVRRAISNFLTLLWRNGALEGTSPAEAYFVKCDRSTMTQTDIDQGRLICLVGVAPVKPAEFVIVRIGLWTAHAEE